MQWWEELTGDSSSSSSLGSSGGPGLVNGLWNKVLSLSFQGKGLRKREKDHLLQDDI